MQIRRRRAPPLPGMGSLQMAAAAMGQSRESLRRGRRATRRRSESGPAPENSRARRRRVERKSHSMPPPTSAVNARRSWRRPAASEAVRRSDDEPRDEQQARASGENAQGRRRSTSRANIGAEIARREIDSGPQLRPYASDAGREERRDQAGGDEGREVFELAHLLAVTRDHPECGYADERAGDSGEGYGGADDHSEMPLDGSRRSRRGKAPASSGFRTGASRRVRRRLPARRGRRVRAVVDEERYPGAGGEPD